MQKAIVPFHRLKRIFASLIETTGNLFVKTVKEVNSNLMSSYTSNKSIR